MLISSPNSIFCPPSFALLVFVEIVWAQLTQWSSHEHDGVGNVLRCMSLSSLSCFLYDLIRMRSLPCASTA